MNILNGKDEPPYALLKLRELYNERDKGNQTITPRLIYTHLQSASMEYTTTVPKNPRVAKELVQYWLDNFDDGLARYDIPDVQVHDIDYVAALICKNDAYEIINKSNKNLRVFAALALLRVLLVSSGTELPPLNNIKNVLEKVFTKEAKGKTTTAPALIVDYMYGRGAWDLYSNDVAMPMQLPAYLLGQGIPVAVNNNHIPQSPPDDLAL